MSKGVEMCIKLTMRDSGGSLDVLREHISTGKFARLTPKLYNSHPRSLRLLMFSKQGMNGSERGYLTRLAIGRVVCVKRGLVWPG